MTNLLSAEFLAELDAACRTIENTTFQTNEEWLAAQLLQDLVGHFHGLAPLLRELVEKREKATDGEWLQHENGLGGVTTEIWINNAETVEKGSRICKHVHGVSNAAFISSAANIAAQIKRKVGE